MAKIKQLKDKSGTEQIFPKTKTQAIFNEDGSLLSETLDNLYGSLATIESSPTTTSHSVGEYILYQGQVYKVTAVIASGDSLVEGTNISAVNLGSQISTLNGQVSTLNSKLTGLQNNKTSGGVSLKNYTQSNPYTFPCDGYVLLDSGSSAQSGTHIWFNIRTANNYNAANLYMAVQQSYQNMSVFVKKGMFCFLYDATATNNFSIYFFPLDMS